MWLIYLFATFVASTATSPYNTQLCPEGGPPVCATNGRAYIYFANECKLNSYIHQQRFFGKPVPVKTDIENCLTDCYDIKCPTVDKPVCVQQVPAGSFKTVKNACLVNQLICETKQHWAVIGDGPCSTLSDTVHTPASYLDQSADPTAESSYSTDQSRDYSAPASVTNGASDQNPSSFSYKGQDHGSAVAAPDLGYYAQDEDYAAPIQTPVIYVVLKQSPVPAHAEKNQDYSDTTPASGSCPASEQSPAPAPSSYEEQYNDYSAPAHTAISYAQDHGNAAPRLAPLPYATPEHSSAPAPSTHVAYSASVPAHYADPDQDLNPAGSSYTLPVASHDEAPVLHLSIYQAPEPTPCSTSASNTVHSAAYPAQSKNTETASSPYTAPAVAPSPSLSTNATSSQNSDQAQSHHEAATSATSSCQASYEVTQTASASTSYPASEAAPDAYTATAPCQSQGSLPVPEPYVIEAPGSATYTETKIGYGQFPAHYSALSSARSHKFASFLNPGLNIYSELAAASNVANFFRSLHWPFGPIYYQPRYIHIVYNDD